MSTKQSRATEFSVDGEWDALYIDGEWRSVPERDRIENLNPATQEPFCRVPAGTADDVDDAFEAAQAAQKDWEETPPQRRAEVVRTVARLIEDHPDEIRELLAVESGSTPPKVDIEYGTTSTMLYDVSSFPFRLNGRVNESTIPGKQNLIERKPVGVVSVIGPWNFPFKLALRAVAPAIALGNSVVLKPAEDTPITDGLLVARLFEAAGLPDGVLNVVTGYGEDAGDRAATHPASGAVSFTGSTEVGRLVGKNAVDHLAEPALELGGNNAHIVLEDADIDDAVASGIFGTYLHQGQICISINRHLVHESLYDEYVERFVERASELTVGDPLEEDTVVGPVINETQRDGIIDYVEGTVDAGATLELGGGYDGLFVEPTVLSDVTNDMPTACNEHFGPVAPIIPFSDDDDAVEMANDTDYGLSGSVHSSDLGHARDVADRIETGMIHLNDQPVNNQPHVPFGGMKSSGVGRYNGDWIMDEFTEPKWTSVQRGPRDYPF